MSKHVLASISGRASNNPSGGHYYWLYKYLQESQFPEGSELRLTIGRIDHASDNICGLLGPSVVSSEFSLGPRSFRDRAYRDVSRYVGQLSRNGVTHVQLYDGGLAELVLAMRLAAEFPTMFFIFNFHWAMQWLQIFSGKTLGQRLLATALRKVLTQKSRNLILTAESHKLAQHLSPALGTPLDTFPIIAAFDEVETQPWSARTNDVLFLPQRSHEIGFCVDVMSELERQGIDVALGIHPHILDRALSSEALSKKWASSGFRIIQLPLPSGEYEVMLQEAKVVVLPYDKDYFHWGSSGKFNEAIALGAFPIVPHDTAISDQSNLDPFVHQFPKFDPRKTALIILKRLESGKPEGLRALHVKDFFDWLHTVSSSEAQRFSTDDNPADWRWLVFSSLLYRNNRTRNLGNRIRERLGRAFRGAKGALHAPERP